MNEEKLKGDIKQAERRLRRERTYNILKCLCTFIILFFLIYVTTMIAIGYVKYDHCQDGRDDLSGEYNGWYMTNCTLSDLLVSKKPREDCYSVKGFYEYSNTTISKILRDCKTLEWIREAKQDIPEFHIGNNITCFYQDVEDSCKVDDGVEFCYDGLLVFDLPNECNGKFVPYLALAISIPLIVILLFGGIIYLCD